MSTTQILKFPKVKWHVEKGRKFVTVQGDFVIVNKQSTQEASPVEDGDKQSYLRSDDLER